MHAHQKSLFSRIFLWRMKIASFFVHNFSVLIRYISSCNDCWKNRECKQHNRRKKPAEESATHYELTNCWINFCLGCFRYPTSLWHIQIVRLPKLCVFALIDSSRLHIKLQLDVMRRIFMTLFSSLHTRICMMHLGMTTKKTNPQRLNWKCGKQYATSRH